MPVVVDGAVGAAQEKKSGLRRSVRLRDHATEELPLRVVAAAAEAASAGELVAAVHRHCLSDRGVAAGRERAAVVPDLVLRLGCQAGDKPLVRGEQAIDPAGRAAAARDGSDDVGEDVKAVFEPAIGLRPHDAEEVQLPHARDHVLADAPVGFGLLRPLTREGSDRARPREEIGNVGFGDRRSSGND